MEEKHIMFSINDDRIKELSEALSNPSCKKIINILSEKELTETDIARELKIPLNTVDYNIKKLIATGLIEKTSHFWSIRGKKMPVYRVSNKQIIISPKKSVSLNALFLSLFGMGIISFGIKKFFQPVIREENFSLMAADSFMASPVVAEKGIELTTGLAQWQWFLIGAWLGILIFFTFSLISERRRKK